MKKNILSLILAAIMLAGAFTFTSCSTGADDTAAAEETAKEPADLDALVAEITAKYSMTDGFTFTSSSTELGEYLDEDLIISYYGDAAEYPDFTKVDSYCVYIDESDPTTIIDVGVFRMNDTSYSETLMSYLQARIDDKIANGDKYPDIDVAMLKTAVVKKSGDYVYYACTYNNEEIITDIEAAVK